LGFSGGDSIGIDEVFQRFRHEDDSSVNSKAGKTYLGCRVEFVVSGIPEEDQQGKRPIEWVTHLSIKA